MARAKERGLTNLKIYTGNIVSWNPQKKKSHLTELFQLENAWSTKNYEKLFAKLATWLKPGGKFFTHIFTHKLYSYHFEAKEESDWMTRYFFSGGTMPSHDLMFYFKRTLTLSNTGMLTVHHGLTSEAWLQNMDTHEAELMPILEDIYGNGEGLKWFARWRGFFLACAECFFGTMVMSGSCHYLV